MIFLGIDPGKNGGLASIEDEGKQGRVLALEPMPGTEHDICSIIREHSKKAVGCGIIAAIERVHSFPGQGVSSSFTFGRSYGFLRGCLVAQWITFVEVGPAKWQRTLGLPAVKGESKTNHKNRTKGLAQQLFPGLKITHATADALLLAEYARRTYAR